MKTTTLHHFELVFVLVVGLFVGTAIGYYFAAFEAAARVHAFEVTK